MGRFPGHPRATITDAQATPEDELPQVSFASNRSVAEARGKRALPSAAATSQELMNRRGPVLVGRAGLACLFCQAARALARLTSALRPCAPPFGWPRRTTSRIRRPYAADRALREWDSCCSRNARRVAPDDLRVEDAASSRPRGASSPAR
jgi:hypothetical protein